MDTRQLTDWLRLQNFDIAKWPIELAREYLDKADQAYYRPGMHPFLTDAEYELVKKNFAAIAPDDPRLTRVGCIYDPEEISEKTVHRIPMGSLDNTDDGILGFEPWLEAIGKDPAATPVMASLKVDGGSICASYRRGELVKVATRGNGEIGEDITANGSNFQNLPIKLREPLNIDVRGEGVLSKANFLAICERDAIPAEDRSNPRNVGNGIFGRFDGRDSDRIEFHAFNAVLFDEDDNQLDEFCSELEKFQSLTDLGFQPVRYELCNTADDFHRFYNSIAAARDEIPYEIDGIVVCLNETAKQNEYVTSDIKTRLRPKYARAVKFPHKCGTTIVTGVTLSVGHTRAIIPTAQLAEVRIGGVNVSNALLNNWDEIVKLGVAIGDSVEVILAGDIIPKIIRVVQPGTNRQPIPEPKVCPSCGSPATKNFRGKESAAVYCTNLKCEAAAIQKIDHWIGTSKKGVGIMDIGDALLKALWDAKLVADAADLYTLVPEQLEKLLINDKMKLGKLRARKAVANIAVKKHVTLSTFLGSIGIDLLGRRRVKILKEAAGGELDTLDDWLNVDKLSTIKVPGLGDTIRAAIIDGITENRELIEKLLRNGVTIDYGTPKASGSGPFSGLSFCLTGTRAFSDEIEKMGGVLKSGVSKGLSILVQADPTSVSKKTQKADELGVMIISIEYLEEAVLGKVDLQAAFAEYQAERAESPVMTE